MNVRTIHDLKDRVVLAHQVPFRLGALMIEPAMRRIAHEDGREEILEQRVMQVLVALVRADGDILTRDDLIACCWGGRIVGDDAINRVMSRLRRVSEGIGDGVFRIETITKVGYRLARDAAAAAPSIPATVIGNGTAPAPRRRRAAAWTAAGIGLALLVLAAAVPSLWRDAASAPAVVAVIAEGSGPEDRALARDLAADLSRLASARPADLLVVDPSRSAEADYAVRIGRGREAGRVQAILSLSNPAGELLWSARFDRSSAQRSEWRPQAVAKLGYVLLCATEAFAAEAGRMDRVTRRSYFALCDHIHDDPDPRALALTREITARAPRFARGWAMRAYAEAFLGGFHDTRVDTPQKRALRRAAGHHAALARRLDGAIGYTYLAETLLLTRPDRWEERLATLDRGIAAAPDFGPLHEYRSFELRHVGRLHDAVESARRAVALDPLSPANRQSLVAALSASGELGEARAELDRVERIWPGTFHARIARTAFESRFGDARRALQLLDEPAFERMRPTGTGPTIRLFLEARISRDPAAIRAMVTGYRAMVRRSPDYSWYAIQSFGEFGLVDEAYHMMDLPGTMPGLQWASEILFRPRMRAFRKDARFMPLAHRLGLVGYWQSSGQWPDFCEEPDLPYDCRADARRLLARRG